MQPRSCMQVFVQACMPRMQHARASRTKGTCRQVQSASRRRASARHLLASCTVASLLPAAGASVPACVRSWQQLPAVVGLACCSGQTPCGMSSGRQAGRSNMATTILMPQQVHTGQSWGSKSGQMCCSSSTCQVSSTIARLRHMRHSMCLPMAAAACQTPQNQYPSLLCQA